jgi:hypothetical protein
MLRYSRPGGGKMRVKPDRGGSNAGGCEPSTSSARRWGAIGRRSAILLGGTAAMALSIAQPVSAIVINDQVAAAGDTSDGAQPLGRSGASPLHLRFGPKATTSPKPMPPPLWTAPTQRDGRASSGQLP